MKRVFFNLLSLLLLALISNSCMTTGKEYHVSKTGNDANTGSDDSPFLTISAAARVAEPGDMITVHAGIYREYVNPLRGGNSDADRIVYRAAPGENVIIKGSEQINTWVNDGGGIWKVEIPNSFFNDQNPYARTLGWVSENWLMTGEWTHCGDVYLNGEAFYEKRKIEEISNEKNTWYTEVDSSVSVTRIWANFGDIDPNTELAEINVRESIISPMDTNVNYITIRGFTIMHSANGWGPPSAYQGAAISTNGGHHWIVENCEIINAKTCGFSMGNPRVRRNRAGLDYDHVGHHIIRNNIFRRCGQSAFVGAGYNTGTYILGNYIGETSYRREFWGHEIAAIKFHNGVDLIIEGNYIGNSNNVRALWIDFGNQNIRLSRNFIGVQIFIEMNHGPILIDNNILEGVYINRGSGAITMAHNLLNIDNFRYTHDPYRKSAYYKAHTRETVMRELSFVRDERWYNNIFIKKGLDSLRINQPASADIQVTRTTPPPPIQLGIDPLTTNYGCAADYNLYLNRAKPHDTYDKNSIASSFNPEYSVRDEGGDVTITFLMNEDALKINGPLITTDFLGIYDPMKLRMENNDGSPITVDMDISGRPRNKANPGVGPFADLKVGQNSFTIFTISDKGPQLNK
jgi:alpha-L-arabinofuranosidase